MYNLTLAIKETIQRTHNVKSIRLEVGQDIAYAAGQFLCVYLLTNPELKRYLSLSSSPTENGYIEFTKKLTQSDFSKVLDGLKAGDRVRVEFPLGKFILQDPTSKIAFLSGGIGITPIRSIAKYVVDKKLGTDIALLYSNHTVKDIVFKDDFEAMQRQYPQLKVVHVLSESAPGFKCTQGLINSQVIKNEVPDFQQRKFYLCGPPGMVEAMRKILEDELALPQENIITENFTGY
jgi:ferredoxin-NADP reductase